MIATARGIDLGSPAEVRQPDNQRLFQQSSLFQIDQQLRQRPVDPGNQVVFQALEVVLMSVPAAIRQCDEPDPRFNHTASQQALLPEWITPILISQLGIFLVNFKRLSRFLSRNHVERGLVVLVQCIEFHGLNAGWPLKGIDHSQHFLAPVNTLVTDSIGWSDVTDDKTRGIGVGENFERTVFQTQNARCPAAEPVVDGTPQIGRAHV